MSFSQELTINGEWTAEHVVYLLADRKNYSPYHEIANQYNAALADQKRDLWEKISCARIEADNWKGLYEKYEKQSVIRGQRADDAERAVDLAINAMIKENDQLKRQLAAERSKVATLVDALEEALELLERDAPIGGRTDKFCKKVRKVLK